MEATRFATGWLPGLEPRQVAAVRELLIGAGLLAVLRVRPAGLLPERVPREAMR
jgi:branched-chain amino acid transport system permease protein